MISIQKLMTNNCIINDFNFENAILPASFYQNDAVLEISKILLGKLLVSVDPVTGGVTGGMIVETEAYCGVTDRACHAHCNRFTKRTQVMYQPGGYAYVYWCYGIHVLFNIVVGSATNPSVVLVRAIEPLIGLEIMRMRRKLTGTPRNLTAGPGILTQALGITVADNGVDLTKNRIFLADIGIPIFSDEAIICSPRVGIASAGEAAIYPWRFRIKGSRWTSPAK
jgi:DNA-3-methyladenine glycosylase